MDDKLIKEAGKRKKTKNYAFWRQFNEKPSIILGCLGKQARQAQQKQAVKACLFTATASRTR